MQFRDSGLSFASNSRARSGRRVLLNVTSLIDVLFMLLIFFMVSTTFVEQPGMKLDLPAAQSSDPSKIESLILYVYQDGSLSLNEQKLTVEQLSEALRIGLAQTPESALNLFADKNVAHGKVIEVMDVARQVGIKKLVVATITER